MRDCRGAGKAALGNTRRRRACGGVVTPGGEREAHCAVLGCAELSAVLCCVELCCVLYGHYGSSN